MLFPVKVDLHAIFRFRSPFPTKSNASSNKILLELARGQTRKAPWLWGARWGRGSAEDKTLVSDPPPQATWLVTKNLLLDTPVPQFPHLQNGSDGPRVRRDRM